MGIIGKVVEGLVKGADMAWTQAVSNEGFEAGLKGEAPRAVFGSEKYEETYEKSYKLGQEAATPKLMNAATKKLEDL